MRGAEQKEAVPGFAQLKDILDEDTSIIVSYIQDIGKIESEILRDLKETHAEITLMNQRLEGLVSYFKYGKK